MSQQQTLEQLLHARISEFTASDKPKEIIDQHVEKMFTSVIDNAFRTYGDMGKAVEEAIKAAMPGNISEMVELAGYNNLIANALKEKWASSGVEADMVRRAGEAVDEVLEDMQMPEHVSLNSLLKAFAEDHAEEAFHEQWEAPRIEVEDGSIGSSEFLHIYFDKEPDDHRKGSFLSRPSRSNYSLENSLAIRIEDGEKHEGHPVGHVYAAKIDNDVLGREYTPFRSLWEKLSAALYYGQAKLIIDCDVDDITYPCHD